MRMLNVQEKKSEWHIYSLVLLGIALSVVALNFLPSESFGFTSTIIAIVLMGLGMSEQWKNNGDAFHLSVMIISGTIIVGIIVYNLLFPEKDQ